MDSAMDSDVESSVFDHEEYDVSSCCVKLCCGNRVLMLEPEEAVMVTNTICSSSTKRMPYGDLGSVQHNTACGCCHSFTSNLSPQDDHGKKVAIMPGWGCSEGLVAEVVEELKARMKGRGDTGNIQRAEEAILMLKTLTAKVDAVMRQMNVPAPQQQMMEEKVMFETKEYDVTNTCCSIVLCCSGSRKLHLDPEEAKVVGTSCCSASVQRRPYGELGSVDKINQCGCLHSVSSGLGPMLPGCGCQEDLVEEVVEELKKRMKARGDTGNIQRQEETIRLMKHQGQKIDMILKQLGVQVPPPIVPPSQNMMA